MTTFDLIVSYPVPVADRADIISLLTSYAATKKGAWLNRMNWRNFEFKYCQKMADSDIMGAFVVTAPNTIYLMPPPNTDFSAPISRTEVEHRSSWISCIASTLAHELRHAWQYRRCKWLYALCCLPILRQFTIEVDATRIQTEADKFFDNLNSIRAAREFEERMQ